MLRELNKLVFGGNIAIFHEFHKPPYGGGNQFLLALKKSFEDQGCTVSVNYIGVNTKACLFNSFNFDFNKLFVYKKLFSKCRFIHRVDGPIDVYRNNDLGVDRKVCDYNNKIADFTIFQSEYSRKKLLEVGLAFKEGEVIVNAVNPEIFNKLGKSKFKSTGKIRIVASSWSDNPKKGAETYKWLEENLDFNKYDFSFVGRSKIQFKKAKMIEALPSEELAKVLKNSDIYLTASENDPCSNALIEALSCGLPAVFLKSGGHPELVKKGGVGFDKTEEILPALEEITNNYRKYQDNIKMSSMAEVVMKYLEVMKG